MNSEFFDRESNPGRPGEVHLCIPVHYRRTIIILILLKYSEIFVLLKRYFEIENFKHVKGHTNSRAILSPRIEKFLQTNTFGNKPVK